MSILKVARMGHPVLRAKARALDKRDIRDVKTQTLIDDMIETMMEYHGVGLAAPQVHTALRLFVASLGLGMPEQKTGLARMWSRSGVVVTGSQNMECEPLRCLAANTRQLLQFIDETGHRLGKLGHELIFK